MKSFINTISLILLFGFSILSNGQSVDSLLKEANKNNLDLKILHNQYLGALEKVPQVSKIPALETGIGLFPLPVETRLGAQVVRFSATQMFPWFGTFDKKKALELSKAKVVNERKAVKNIELDFSIKKAYLRLYEIQQSQSIIARNISLLEALERVALAKVESSKTSATDVLNIQLEMQELKNKIALLEADKIEPTVEINQILDRPPNASIEITDTISFAKLYFQKDALFSIIQSNHPMIKLYELEQGVARQAIEINKLNSKPSFGAGLDYVFVNPRKDAEPTNNGRDIIQLKAMVKIPLYRQNYHAKEREENLKIETLEAQKANLLAKYISNIEKAYARHESARLKNELYKQQIALTKTTINMLETEYSANGNNFDELLRMEKKLIDYDLKNLQAIVQSHLAVFSIEKYIIQ